MFILPFRILFLLLVTHSVTVFATKGEDATAAKIEETTAADQEGHHGWAPIAGYNPTYSVFLGAAYFYTSKETNVSTFGIFTMQRVFQVKISYRQKLGRHFQFQFDPDYSQGFDPYYGEGGQTQVKDLINIFGSRFLLKPTFSYLLDQNISFGVFGDFRARRETPEPRGAMYHVFPNENTIGTGVYLQFDYRDDEQNPKDGYILRTEYRYMPSSWGDLAKRDFSQLEGTLTLFRELIPNSEIVAAVSLRAGNSFGDPTYLYRYRLGGNMLLRGYLENRFRGKKFYLQQDELRFPIWKMFNGAVFMGFGDATDTDFANPHLIYGVGLRIGLPPDWVSKVRIDAGWGKDQAGVFVDFGHAF